MNSIMFNGFATGAILLSNGELVPNLGTPLSTITRGDSTVTDCLPGADITLMLQALTNLNAFEQTQQLSDADLLTMADVNQSSGSITNADIQAELELVSQNSSTVSSVPEPASWLLVSLGE